MSDLPPLRDVIAKHGLRAKKSLGQNFILDLNLTDKIARTAGDLTDRLVVEIGPGPGGLTRSLIAGGARQVIAVERDARCRSALLEIADHWPDKLTILDGDALETNWPQIVQPHLAGTTERVAIVANLPYNIATKLLVGWLQTSAWPPWFDHMSLMFQREVADRIVAPPHTKPFGRLSVLSQWRCQCKIAMTLPPAAFSPAPKVASAVVTLTPHPRPEPECDVHQLGRLTQAVFGQRRKMLRSSLRQITPFPELLLDRLNIRPELRAEDLTVEQLVALAATLDQS